jgi:hypothetical protein
MDFSERGCLPADRQAGVRSTRRSTLERGTASVCFEALTASGTAAAAPVDTAALQFLRRMAIAPAVWRAVMQRSAVAAFGAFRMGLVVPTLPSLLNPKR